MSHYLFTYKMDYTNSYKRVNIFNPTYMESILYFKHNILNWLLQDYPFQSQYTSIYEEYFMQWKSIQYLLFLFVTMTAWGTQVTYVWKVFRKLMGCVYYGKENGFQKCFEPNKSFKIPFPSTFSSTVVSIYLFSISGKHRSSFWWSQSWHHELYGVKIGFSYWKNMADKDPLCINAGSGFIWQIKVVVFLNYYKPNETN